MRGGAWCPRSVIQTGVREWLEVNLRQEFWLSATETQGRFGGGQGQEYTQQYQIQYWRDTLGTPVHAPVPDTVLERYLRYTSTRTSTRYSTGEIP